MKCYWCKTELDDDFTVPAECPGCERRLVLITTLPYSEETIEGRALNDILAQEDLRTFQFLKGAGS